MTKGVDADRVRAAIAAGMRTFGESRVQEALPKIAALSRAEWHLIGRLQANKARKAAAAFHAIHSVDSLQLLERLDRVAGEEAVRPLALLEVNVSGEAAKGGFDASLLADGSSIATLAAAVVAARHLRVAGLMTIAPVVATPADARPFFRRLRELRDALQDGVGRALPELSMGMSADAEAAVAEGATLVRVGTALFGQRARPAPR